MAGMLVEERTEDPRWIAVPFAPDAAIKFDYETSMGLRQGEKQWRDALDAWIAGHRPQIDSILSSYEVPLVDATGHVTSQVMDGNL